MKLAELDTPVLLIDRAALARNIARMQEMAANAGIAYRPHAKAHKSPVIAELQMAAGAVGQCCAKLGEAEVLAAGGVRDILITTPVVGSGKINRLMNVLNEARVAVVTDSSANVAALAQAAQTAGRAIDALVEVDVGQGRCGVPSADAAAALAAEIADQKWLKFRGLQGYQGAVQMLASAAERRAKVKDALNRLLAAAEAVRSRGLAVEVLTGGGTGSSAIDCALKGLTELQPGSYIFMDSKYAGIEWEGANRVPFENALTVLASVISKPARDHAIVDAGMKAASGDGGLPLAMDLAGGTFSFAGDEHGHLRFDGACPLEIGAQVRLIPSHCDTTVNLYDQYVVVEGDEVADVWDIAARGRVQ